MFRQDDVILKGRSRRTRCVAFPCGAARCAVPLNACNCYLFNNIDICIAPYGRNFRGAGPGSVLVGVRRGKRVSLREMFLARFLARDVIYTSRAYATMSVSICLSVCL